MNDKETALIVGVGPGLGTALGRRFASVGMRVALAARTAGSVDGLAADLAGIAGEGKAYACDASDETQVEALFERVVADFAVPDGVVFNAGAFVRKGILETEAEEFERCWRIGCLGGFLVGRAAARVMIGQGRGTILFTGATASLRGGANFHNLAVPKFGLRALAQSMARELQPQNIHVAHFVIDGGINRGPDDPRSNRGEDGLLEPDEIAKTYLHVHRQHRSSWTWEIELRPWGEKF